MHVNSDDLVDIAEGTRPEASAPHLAECEPCRAQLRELRAMIAAARDVDVPEPSPPFWDHLSARVSESIAAEGRESRRSSRWVGVSGGGPSWLHARWVEASIIAAAAVLLAVTVTLRSPAPVAPRAPVTVSTAEAAPELLDDGPGDDASLRLVASLADGLDFDGEREAGLAARGSAEHAVIHMSAGELSELRRLLKEELE
jgi:hypothetical protein